MNSSYHPFHLVDYSPWPYTLGWGAFSTTLGAVIYFHYSYMVFLLFGLMLLSISMIVWFSDMISEATFQGIHTLKVVKGLKMGMMLFMVSEICFFFSFFWAFFHSSLTPAMELGCQWPPIGIEAMNPFAVPLLNTAILLASGATVTWAHHAMVSGGLLSCSDEGVLEPVLYEWEDPEKYLSEQSIMALSATIGLGAFFTLIQGMEYYYCPFSMSDSCFGSTFFVATGFHGLHVIIGTVFLLISLASVIEHHFTPSHHFGFEAAAWYWHFVDVVWLFLFICIYWWGC